MFSWLFGRGRKQQMSRPVNGQWQYWMADNVWHWHVFTEPQRRRLSGLVNIFVNEKTFEGCDGLMVTDEMKVTIAAAACVLLVGFTDTYCFDQAKTMLVFPAAMVQRNLHKSGGIVNPNAYVAGMATQRGPIVLSWRDVLSNCRDEQSVHNVVIHEFAHYIDGLDGAMEGIPPLPTRQQQNRWRDLAKAELKNLREAAITGRETVLDPYGAENLAELFAVATEAFYCDGLNLYTHHPEMYELLTTLYRIETKQWFVAS